MLSNVFRKFINYWTPSSLMEKSLKTLAHGSFSTGSLRVIERLQQHGYQAFFVGGCVRDILTGHIPKDFDIVTDARPRQITALFSNGIVIGKRFTLVHIRWKDELVEVATFRKNDSGLDLTKDPEILKNDNVYGTLQDDLIRRDFAINALYYDPFAHKLIDECGGLRDIYNKEISTIGPDEHRFTEDPVRMIRAVRYAAKLGLSLSRGIQKGIATKSLLLAHVPKARLYEEYLKCFNHNKAKAVFDLMHKHKLIRLLIPKILAQPQLCKSVGSLLQKLQHINPDKEHMPALITYCFMAPVWATQSVKNLKTFESIFFSFNTLISIPRQIDIALKEVFLGIMPSSEEAHRYRLLAKMKVFKNHCHVLLKTSLKC